jgi:hypothetical protein
MGKQLLAELFQEQHWLHAVITQFSCNRTRAKRGEQILPIESSAWKQEQEGDDWKNTSQLVASQFASISTSCKTVASIVYSILTGDNRGINELFSKTDQDIFEWDGFMSDYKGVKSDTQRTNGRAWMISLIDTSQERAPPSPATMKKLIESQKSGRITKEEMFQSRANAVRAAGAYSHRFVIVASPTGTTPDDWLYQIYSAFEYETYSLSQWLNTGAFEVPGAGPTPSDVARSPYRNAMNSAVFREFLIDLRTCVASHTCTLEVANAFRSCFGYSLAHMVGKNMAYERGKRMAFSYVAEDVEIDGVMQRAEAIVRLIE